MIEKVALVYILFCLPSVLQVLFAERDMNMIRTIDDITRDIKAKRSNGISQGDGMSDEAVIVAIVGLAHINSMLNIVKNSELKEFAEQRVEKVTAKNNSEACETESG